MCSSEFEPCLGSFIAVFNYHIDLGEASGAVKISFQIGTASRLIGSNGKAAEEKERCALRLTDQRCVRLMSLCRVQK